MTMTARQGAAAAPFVRICLLAGLLFGLAGGLAGRDSIAAERQLAQATGGWMGIRIQDLTRESATARGFPGESGVLVSAVVPGGPAASAGLRAGDIVVEIDERPVARMEPVVFLIGARDPSQAVAVVHYRGGARQETTVRLAERATARRLEADEDAQARAYRQGFESYQAGDSARAAQIMRALAEQGHRSARYFVGYLRETGQGLAADIERAADWYRLSAEQGLAEAQVGLARLYEAGLGVPRDAVRAFYWFQRAASNGAESAAADRDRLAARLGRGGREQAAALAALMPDRIEPGAQAAQTEIATPSPATPAKASADRGLVREIQRQLARLGFDPGPADGLMGGRTRQAIRAYQQREGLGRDGQATTALLSRLRESVAADAAPAVIVSEPTPSEAAATAEPLPAELEDLEELDDF